MIGLMLLVVIPGKIKCLKSFNLQLLLVLLAHVMLLISFLRTAQENQRIFLIKDLNKVSKVYYQKDIQQKCSNISGNNVQARNNTLLIVISVFFLITNLLLDSKLSQHKDLQ